MWGDVDVLPGEGVLSLQRTGVPVPGDWPGRVGRHQTEDRPPPPGGQPVVELGQVRHHRQLVRSAASQVVHVQEGRYTQLVLGQAEGEGAVAGNVMSLLGSVNKIGQIVLLGRY